MKLKTCLKTLLIIVFASLMTLTVNVGSVTADDSSSDTLYGFSSDNSEGADEYCKVKSDQDVPQGLTVRTFVKLFNRTTDTQRQCRSHIDFDLDKVGDIFLKEEILISGNPSSDAPKTMFTFGPQSDPDPSNPTKGFAHFQVNRNNFKMTGEKQEDQLASGKTNAYTDFEKLNCAIKVTSKNVVIQNVHLDGQRYEFESNGEVVHGICITGSGGKVVLKNVVIDGMPGAGVIVDGSTQVVFEGDYGKVIDCQEGIVAQGIRNDIRIPVIRKELPSECAQVTLENCGECGGTIVPTGEDSEGNEISECRMDDVVATSVAGQIHSFAFYNNFTDASSSNYAISDEDAIIGKNIRGSIGDGYFIDYDSIFIEELDSVGDIVRIAGQVVDCDPDLANCTPKGANIDTVSIYTEPDMSTNILSKNSNFSPYVRDLTEAEMLGSIEGWFEFDVNLKELGIENRRMYLVPIHNGIAGSSTEAFWPEHHVGTAQDQPSLDGYVTTSHSNIPVFALGKTGCTQRVGEYSSPFASNSDSDGDGIWDNMEFSIDKNGQRITGKRDCICDKSKNLGCWYEADWGNDGILDVYEFKCMKVINDGKDDKFAREIEIEDMPKQGCSFLGDEWVALDTDGDGEPDVHDQDNDGDGILDYQENRKREYQQDRKAYLYYMDEDVKFRAADGDDEDSIGDAVECQHLDSYKAKEKIGRSFGIFEIDEETGVFSELVIDKGISTDKTVLFLECRNAWLEPDKDLDGSISDQKDNDRSNFAKYDSDGDKIHDGEDACPWIPNEAGKPCVRTCQNKEILYTIVDKAKKYLVYEDDRPVRFKMNEEDTGDVPLLFAEIKDAYSAKDIISACPDNDQDGIPGCVEAYVGRGLNHLLDCQDVDDKQFLAYDIADTDGDNIPDGEDYCPYDPNTETLEDLNGEYPECRNGIFDGSELLAWYLDSDKDGLSDAEEMLELKEIKGNTVEVDIEDLLEVVSNPYQPNATSKLSPTNPLKADSDDDGLSDSVERRNLGTMPHNEDTDGDSLSDYAEVSRDGNINDSGAAYQGVKGCSDSNMQIASRDTDPTMPDTDLDGLNDDVEINVLKTNPNNPDSDGDGLCDGTKPVEATAFFGGCDEGELFNTPAGEEFAVAWYESDPCGTDTDDDGIPDNQELFGCRNSELDYDVCEGYDREEFEILFGDMQDDDRDGLPNDQEEKIGTDPNNWDSDGDKLADGCDPMTKEGELCISLLKDKYSKLSPILGQDPATHDPSPYQSCGTEAPFDQCDTNPLSADTDNDGVSDYNERHYQGKGRYGLIEAAPSNPRNADTDSDCIPDGPSFLADGTWSYGENKDGDEYFDADETCVSAINMQEAQDTDGDGLPDGKIGIYGEDLDCNGTNLDANGNIVEFNPTEIISNVASGQTDAHHFNNQFRKAGCSMSAGGKIDSSVMILFAGLMMLIGAIRRRITSKS